MVFIVFGCHGQPKQTAPLMMSATNGCLEPSHESTNQRCFGWFFRSDKRAAIWKLGHRRHTTLRAKSSRRVAQTARSGRSHKNQNNRVVKSRHQYPKIEMNIGHHALLNANHNLVSDS